MVDPNLSVLKTVLQSEFDVLAQRLAFLLCQGCKSSLRSSTIKRCLKSIGKNEPHHLLFPEEALISALITPDFPYIHKELLKSGVTLKLLRQEYVAQNKLTMHIQHKPGDKHMVDLAGTSLLPARALAPRHKSAVEGSVGNLASHIIARLRNREFFNIHTLNVAIRKELDRFNVSAYFRWLIRILQKSKKVGTPIRQRKKAKIKRGGMNCLLINLFVIVKFVMVFVTENL